mmetsp:Transcript_178570/g.572376  ORF Transcript_178570/g.572376 Transcript_178570/m.572376 type:complete len:357 (+) Transcript_178570:887-1957(+)
MATVGRGLDALAELRDDGRADATYGALGGGRLLLCRITLVVEEAFDLVQRTLCFEDRGLCLPNLSFQGSSVVHHLVESLLQAIQRFRPQALRLLPRRLEDVRGLIEKPRRFALQYPHAVEELVWFTRPVQVQRVAVAGQFNAGTFQMFEQLLALLHAGAEHVPGTGQHIALPLEGVLDVVLHILRRRPLRPKVQALVRDALQRDLAAGGPLQVGDDRRDAPRSHVDNLHQVHQRFGDAFFGEAPLLHPVLGRDARASDRRDGGHGVAIEVPAEDALRLPSEGPSAVDLLVHLCLPRGMIRARRAHGQRHRVFAALAQCATCTTSRPTRHRLQGLLRGPRRPWGRVREVLDICLRPC